MKKVTAVLLALLLTVSFTACSKKENSSSSGSSGSSTGSSETGSSREEESDKPSEPSGESAASGVTPEDFVKEVVGAIPDLSLEQIDEQMLTEMYHVNMDDVEEFYGQMSMVNVLAFDFVVVKAKEGRADAVKEALETRKQDRIKEFEQYPVNDNDIHTQNAQVIAKGDYVILLVTDDYDTPVEMLKNYFND